MFVSDISSEEHRVHSVERGEPGWREISAQSKHRRGGPGGSAVERDRIPPIQKRRHVRQALQNAPSRPAPRFAKTDLGRILAQASLRSQMRSALRFASIPIARSARWGRALGAAV